MCHGHSLVDDGRCVCCESQSPTGFTAARLQQQQLPGYIVRLAAGINRRSMGGACIPQGAVKSNALMWDCCWQERDTEVQGLQQRLAEAEEAHEEELTDLQAAIQSCSAKLQDSKVLLHRLQHCRHVAHAATPGHTHCLPTALCTFTLMWLSSQAPACTTSIVMLLQSSQYQQRLYNVSCHAGFI